MFTNILRVIFICFSISIFANEPSKKIELEYTEDELKSMDKWKAKSSDDLVNDCFAGDPSAIYMVGMSFLYGKLGNTINVKAADKFFSRSASKGFAPALDKIRAKYMEEDNPFLCIVYLNLTISLGHSEFIVKYHEIRENYNNKYGNKIFEEIERIAYEKKKIIDKNTSENLDYCKMGVITFEDLIFDKEYWEEIITNKGKK